MIAFITPFPSSLLPAWVALNATSASSKAYLGTTCQGTNNKLFMRRHMPMSHKRLEVDLSFSDESHSHRIVARLSK